MSQQPHPPEQSQASDLASTRLEVAQEDENPNISVKREGTASYAGLLAAERSRITRIKRPASDFHPQQPYKKRRFLTDPRCLGYVKLLNEQIRHLVSGVRYEPDLDQELLPASWIGCTFWPSAEKELFFDALVRFGRDDLAKIAEAVGNGKSAVQVKEYLMLLEEAANECRMGEGGLTMDQVPAAIEVEGNVRLGLVEAAETVEQRTLRFEERTEYQKWGDYWLLDANIAAQVFEYYEAEADEYRAETKKEMERRKIELEKARATNPDAIMNRIPSTQEWKQWQQRPPNPDPILSAIPSAELLNLPNFLRLSTNVYMNSRKRHDWNTPLPAIRHTAFADFHNLAVSVTRRLISTTIFQTESRLRARKNIPLGSERILARKVYAYDVQNALNILGMPKDSGDYWVTLPRRFGLTCTVYKFHKLKIELDLEGVVDPDIVEERLRIPLKKKDRDLARRKQEGEDEMDLEEDEGDTSGEEMEIDEAGPSLAKEESSDEEESDETTDSVSEESEDEEDSSSEDLSSGQMAKASGEEGDERETEDSEAVESDASSSNATSNASTDDEDDFTMQELEAIYPAMFDQSQRATSEDQYKQQLQDMMSKLEEEAAEEDYLEAIDRQVSAREEKRLWAIMDGGDYESPDEEADSAETQVEKEAAGGLGFGMPARNWREHTRYISEWESRCLMEHSTETK